MFFWIQVQFRYSISSYSFRGNYSFLNLEIVANSNSCRNISIFYLINWTFAAETIQGNTVPRMIILILCYYHLCIIIPSGRKIQEEGDTYWNPQRCWYRSYLGFCWNQKECRFLGMHFVKRRLPNHLHSWRSSPTWKVKLIACFHSSWIKTFTEN